MTSPTPRDQSILEHRDLVRAIASRLGQRLPRHVDRDDLMQAGMLGLIEAVDRYDPRTGVPLRRFAALRIRGAMLDALRRTDHASRRARHRQAELEAARSRLRQRTGQEPGTIELARALSVPIERYEAWCRAAQVPRLVSLDHGVGDDDDESPLSESIASPMGTAEDDCIRAEQHLDLAAAVQTLPERQRRVVQLTVLDEHSLREVGADLGVTQSQACRIRTAALLRLRHRLPHLAA